jgi:O-antigen ligase
MVTSVGKNPLKHVKQYPIPRNRVQHLLDWIMIIGPMIAFFFPLDVFFAIGTIACVVMVLHVRTFWRALITRGSYWFMGFTFLLIGLSVWQNNFLGLVACGFLLLIVIYFTYLRYVMTPHLMETLTWIVGLGSLISLYYTTIDFYGPNTIALYEFFIKYIPLGFSFISGIAGDPNPASTFISSNFYGHLSAVMALISMAMVAEALRTFHQRRIFNSIKIIVFTLSVGVNLVALDLTLSWSAHLGLVAGIAVFALVWDWRWFVGVSIGIALLAVFQKQWIIDFFPPMDDWGSSAAYRFKLYRAAFLEVLKFPLFGRGLYTFPTFVEAYDTGYQVHSHNLMLEFLLSGGLAGLVLFGAYIKSVIGKAFHQWIRKGHPRMALMWGMIALELANGLTDAVIVFPQSFVLFCLVLLMTEVKNDPLMVSDDRVGHSPT